MRSVLARQYPNGRVSDRYRGGDPEEGRGRTQIWSHRLVWLGVVRERLGNKIGSDG